MKKGKVLGLMALSAVLLTGCVDSMPDLTTEESDIITEYAASLILKYSPYYNYKIVSEEEVAAARAQEQDLVETAAQEETEVPPDEDVASIGTLAYESEEPEQEEPTVEVVQSVDGIDFAAELGIDDVILRYQSFELCDSYPQNNSGFRVDAVQDKKLLVVHFDLEGSPEEDVNCDMVDYAIKLRMNINDTVSATALDTVLPDSLMEFIDVIPAGETVDVVVMAEVDDITEEDIENLTIRMSSAAGSCTVRLK